MKVWEGNSAKRLTLNRIRGPTQPTIGSGQVGLKLFYKV